METENAELHKLLIDCLKKDTQRIDPAGFAALTPERWQNLLALAAGHRITPLLWHRLKQKGLDKIVPEAVAASLKEASRRNTMNNLRLSRELHLLLSTLEAENIPVIPLKGIVLANTVYENISLREMNDIDVLVRPEHLERIASSLIKMGYPPIQTLSVNFTMQTKHHLPCFIKKGRAKIEVHWNITHPNKSYSIDPQGLWERAMPVKIAGCRTMMFSPEDMLLHICLHTSYLHPFNFGLRPFCDIAEIIDHFGSDLDWGMVVDRACGQGWQRGVYLAMQLAVDLAGASVPRDVLEGLQPANASKIILQTVTAQIFTDKYVAAGMSKPFVEFLKNRRLIDKIKIIWQRVFMPRVWISNTYSVPMDSPRIYLCYLRRFNDLLRHHQSTFNKFQHNDEEVTSLLERTNLIANWMEVNL